MKLRLSKIYEAAASRPAGYVEEVLASGQIVGEWVEITPEAMEGLRRKFRPQPDRLPAAWRGETSVVSIDVAAPLQKPPSITKMAASLASALVSEAKAAVSGAARVDEEVVKVRLSVCQACEKFIAAQGRCSLCGCFSALKARLRSQHCPIGKW